MQTNLRVRQVNSVPGHLPRSLTFFNDGRHVLSVMGESILVSDLDNEHPQRMIRGHDDLITCLASSHHSGLIASGQVGNNSDVLVWDMASGDIRFRLSEHDYEISVVEFSDDDRLMLSIGNFMDNKLFIWDNKTGYIVGMKTLEEVAVCAAWGGKVRDIKWRESANYRFAVALETSLTIWELDPSSGALNYEKIGTGSTKREFKCVTFTPGDQSLLLAGTKSADFFVVNMKTKSLQNIVRLGNLGVTSVAINTSSIFFGCGDGTLAQYVCQAGKIVLVDSINLGKKITSMSTQGEEVLVGLDQSQALIVNQNGLKAGLIQEAHRNNINYVKFFDGSSNLFASASDDASIRFWDLEKNKVIGRVFSKNNEPAKCMQIKDEIMISGWGDGSLKMHEVSTTNQIWEISNTHKNGLESLELSEDMRFIATGGGDGVARIWELRSRSMVSNLKEHANRITKVKLLPSNMMVTSSRDKSLLLWDLNKEKRLTSFSLSMGGVNSFDIVPGSSTLISTGQDRKITIWDLRTSDPQMTINTDDRADTSEECYSLRIKGQGGHFVTSGSSNFVKLWDISSGKMLDKKQCHSRGINTLDISADDTKMVSGSNDYSLAIWDI